MTLRLRSDRSDTRRFANELWGVLPWRGSVAWLVVLGLCVGGLAAARACATCDGVMCAPCAGTDVTADLSAFVRPGDRPDSVRLCSDECFYKFSGDRHDARSPHAGQEPAPFDPSQVRGVVHGVSTFENLRILLMRDGHVVRSSVQNSVQVTLPEPRPPGECCSCGRVTFTADETGKITTIRVSR